MIVEDIALTLVPGLGLKGVVRLLECFESAAKIFGASREELIHFAQLNPAIADSLLLKSGFAQAQREVEYCRRNGISPIASTDEAYPPLLREANDYPHVIYVMGDPSVLRRRCVSLVGTRKVSSYGDRVCYDIVNDLAAKLPDVAIVSGLAFGVDSASHRAALHYKVPTVAVVPCALPSVVPSQHSALAADILKSGGVIVSECHSLTKQRGHLYHARNRIIAALSGVTVVVESPISGGSMVTAAIADGYKRLVMAVSGRLSDGNSAGCNMLIRNRVAQIYTSADQLIREMMWDDYGPSDCAVVTPLVTDLNDAQRALVACFELGEPTSIEALSDRSGLSVSDLSVALLELELNGVVRMLHGNRCELLSVVVSR